MRPDLPGADFLFVTDMSDAPLLRDAIDADAVDQLADNIQSLLFPDVAGDQSVHAVPLPADGFRDLVNRCTLLRAQQGDDLLQLGTRA